jgi:hypothetical protein
LWPIVIISLRSPKLREYKPTSLACGGGVHFAYNPATCSKNLIDVAACAAKIESHRLHP